MVPALVLGRCAGKAESGSGAPLPWEALCKLSCGFGSSAGTCCTFCLLVASHSLVLPHFFVYWQVTVSLESPQLLFSAQRFRYQEFCEFSMTMATSAALPRAAAVPCILSCPPNCLLGAVPGTAPAFPKNVLRHCLGKCCLAQARSCGWLTNRLG